MIFSDLNPQSLNSVKLESILFSFFCDNLVKYSLHCGVCTLTQCVCKYEYEYEM